MHWIQILTFLQQIDVTVECQYLNRIFYDVEDQITLQPQSILSGTLALIPIVGKIRVSFPKLTNVTIHVNSNF